MNREEVHALIKQWSHETCFLSFHDRKHPAYRALVAAGEEVVPFILERLQDSIGHDSGDDMDHDNSPWISVCVIGDITKHASTKDFPREHAGCLDELRKHILDWGKKNAHL